MTIGKRWRKSGKGTEELGITEADTEQGGVRQESVGEFFKVVVQQVLLFGVETWVVTPRMERALSSFMHGAAMRITGRQPRRGWDRKWFYPSLEGAMKAAGFKDIRTSINTRQNMVTQYITTRPLLDLCKGTNQIGGGKGGNEVVGSKGDKLEEIEIKGGGGGIRIGDRHGRRRDKDFSQ